MKPIENMKYYFGKYILKTVIVILVWFMFSEYTAIYASLVSQADASICEEANVTCSSFMSISGQYAAITSIVFLSLFTFTNQKQILLKYMIIFSHLFLFYIQQELDSLI